MLESRPVDLPAAGAAGLAPMMRDGALRAAGALSEMSGRCIETRSISLRAVPLADLPLVAGDPERPVVAVHLGVQEPHGGHILLALSEQMALRLVDMLLAQPAGTTTSLDEMEVSALAETGNVAGAAFLTALADRARVILPPTPPLVFHEMCGAILQTLAAELALSEQRDAVVVETEFTCDDESVDVAFFLFPAPEMVRAVASGLVEGSDDACSRD